MVIRSEIIIINLMFFSRFHKVFQKKDGIWNTMILSVNLEEEIEKIDTPYSPVEIASINQYAVRMALFEGEYHWHRHLNEDELFFVYSGAIVIQLRDMPDKTLYAGELAVVPKGVEHCPKSLQPSAVLMFEPRALQSRGD